MVEEFNTNLECITLMKRGRWSFLQRPNGSKGAYHNCLRFEEQFKHLDRPIVSFPVGFFGDANITKTASHPVDPEWRCGACNRKAPKSIVALAEKEK